jgi:hypothetical protein
MEKYSYKIFPEKRLIIKYYQGKFSIVDFIKCMEITGQDSLFDSTFNVINDFMDAELSVEINEIREFVNYIKGHNILYGKRKSTFLTRTPNQTVFTIMLDQVSDETLVNIKTFSTLSALTKWLGFPLSDSDIIEDYINELKKST